MRATGSNNTSQSKFLSFPNRRVSLSFAVVLSTLHFFRIVILFHYNGISVQRLRYPHKFMTEDPNESHS